MFEELLVSLKDVSVLLLPILGCIVLVYLILILKKVLGTLTKVEGVLSNVDGKLNQLEAPLTTFNKLAHTIDDVHDASVRGVNGAISYLAKNMATITAWFKQLLDEYNESKGATTEGDEQ